uniref:Putative secreted protein n=1 Tax=Anopheles darlingi TaxID=43151 RepID=A0A2M4D8F8_ANODA
MPLKMATSSILIYIYMCVRACVCVCLHWTAHTQLCLYLYRSSFAAYPAQPHSPHTHTHTQKQQHQRTHTHTKTTYR